MRGAPVTSLARAQTNTKESSRPRNLAKGIIPELLALRRGPLIQTATHFEPERGSAAQPKSLLRYQLISLHFCPDADPEQVGAFHRVFPLPSGQPAAGAGYWASAGVTLGIPRFQLLDRLPRQVDIAVEVALIEDQRSARPGEVYQTRILTLRADTLAAA
jgi:hypothetical protein